MIKDFKGKTAVLTGAGSGFGLECARIGAKLGMNLVLVDVQQDALDKAAAELQAQGVQVMAHKVDVGNAAAMELLANQVKARFGAPHLVFNNAGVAAGGLVWENTVADWNWVLGVNLMGVVHGVRALPQPALARWYAAADMLLLASEREGWPNVLLECMACGTPVVATNVGGIPEIVKVPQTGCVVQERSAASLAAAVAALWQAPLERRAVRAHAEGFGWQWNQFSEIAVKRVLTRDGTSSYFINNQPVRRRDVQDVFLGTGLGPRAYAIIGQGTISRIIESKPEELRMFLEEAAGVSKYKERRRETENRLKDTRENLTRVEDILRELNNNLERLERQAEVAARYHGLQEQGTLKLHQLWFLKHRDATSEESRIRLAVAEATNALEARMAELRGVEAELEHVRQDRLDLLGRQTEVAVGVHLRRRLGDEVRCHREALPHRRHHHDGGAERPALLHLVERRLDHGL